MFKYKCTSRYKMLLVVDDKIIEIRPQEVVVFNNQFKNKFLKRVYDKTTKESSPTQTSKKKITIKEHDITVKNLTMEKTHGSS